VIGQTDVYLSDLNDFGRLIFHHPDQRGGSCDTKSVASSFPVQYDQSSVCAVNPIRVESLPR